MQALIGSFRQRYEGSISEKTESLDPAVRVALANEIEQTFVFGRNNDDTVSSSRQIETQHENGECSDERDEDEAERNTIRSVEETVKLVQDAIKESSETLQEHEKKESFLAERIHAYEKQLDVVRSGLVNEIKAKNGVPIESVNKEDEKLLNSSSPTKNKDEENLQFSGGQCCALEVYSLTDSVCGDPSLYGCPNPPLSEEEQKRIKAREEEDVLLSFANNVSQKALKTEESNHVGDADADDGDEALRSKVNKYLSHRKSLLQVQTAHDETVQNIRQSQRRVIVLQRVEQDLQTKNQECQEFLQAVEHLTQKDHEHDLSLFVEEEDEVEMTTINNNSSKLEENKSDEHNLQDVEQGANTEDNTPSSQGDTLPETNAKESSSTSPEKTDTAI